MATQHDHRDTMTLLEYPHAASPSKRRRLSPDRDSSDDSILAPSIIPKEKRSSSYNALHSNGLSRKDRAKEEGSTRRRKSAGQDYDKDPWQESLVLPKDTISRSYGANVVHFNGLSGKDQVEEEESITISATSKQATQTVAPFLAKHIPEQYAPMGGLDQAGHSRSKDTNTKYCYRHRPDMKCRRQANEPSMDQLQHVCVYILSQSRGSLIKG